MDAGADLEQVDRLAEQVHGQVERGRARQVGLGREDDVGLGGAAGVPLVGEGRDLDVARELARVRAELGAQRLRRQHLADLLLARIRRLLQVRQVRPDEGTHCRDVVSSVESTKVRPYHRFSLFQPFLLQA